MPVPSRPRRFFREHYQKTVSWKSMSSPDWSGMKLWWSMKQDWVIKKIFHVLNISQNTIKSIIWKWKEFDTNCKPTKTWIATQTVRLIKEKLNHRSNQMVCGNSGGAAKLHSWENLYTGQLNKSSLYKRVARRKPLLKESHKKSCSQFFTTCVWDTTDIWKNVLWSDLAKIELELNAKYHVW